jgi:hypothetical protein
VADFFVNGIVAQRDKQPYIQLSNEKGMIAQLSLAEARHIAMDILVMCSRTEADAMVLKFFKRSEFPDGAAEHLMQMFREYRMELDQEKVETSYRDPETGEVR